jgi:hypothetical protein
MGLATISSWLTLGPLGTGSHARVRGAGMLTWPQ